YNGVYTHPGRSAVSLSPFHLDGKPVGCCHHSGFFVTDRAQLADGLDMHAEDHIHFGIFQHAFLYHQFGAAFFSRRGSFFCRLKNEFHGPPKLISVLRKNFGDGHQDRDMRIMTTCVHHARLHSRIRCSRSRLKGKIVSFSNRKRIHVRAQRDYRSRLSTFQKSYNPGMRNARLRFDAEGPEMFSYLLCRLEFPVGKFRVLMEVSSPLDDLWLYFGGHLIDFGLQGWAYLGLHGKTSTKES